MDTGIILTNTQTADWFLNFACHSLVILIIARITSLVFKRSSAPLRSSISLSAMIVLLALPLCSLVFQPKKVLLFASPMMDAPATKTARLGNMDLKGATLDDESPGQTAAGSAELTGTGRDKAAGIVTKPLINLSKTDLVRLVNCLGIIWLAGFSFILLRFFYGMVALFRFRSGLIRVLDSRVEKILPSLQKTFKAARLPPLYISLDIDSPIIMGLLNPAVIIPHELYRKIGSEELKSILLHEMSHIHHKDQVFGMLQVIITALNWWNPLVYAVSREFSRAREYISDNYAIRGNDPRRYARCLVSLARKKNLKGMLPAVVGMAAPQITLEERIKGIISKERIMKTKLKKSITYLFITVSFLLTIFMVSNSWTFASELGQQVGQPGETETGKPVPLPASSSASVEEMHDAVKKGDTGKISMLLEQNPGLLNAKNKNGLTPLFWALDLGLGEAAKFLIEKGADITIRGYRSRTMLHMAARAGEADVIKALLGKGAEVNVKDSRGETPLHLLSRARDEFVESAQLLVEKGADVNARDNEGNTPLVLALYGGKRNIARIFVENGADVNAKAPAKKYVVRETGNGYDLEIDGKKAYTFSGKYFTAGEAADEDIEQAVSLISLLLSDSKDFYRLLKERGGTVDEQTLEEISTLTKVKKRKGKGTYYKLVINGKVNSFVHKEQLNKKTLKKILQSMAEYNEIILNKAIISGCSDLAKLMIEKGADVNAVDRKGNKPLYYAKKYNRREIADLLISRGGN